MHTMLGGARDTETTPAHNAPVIRPIRPDDADGLISFHDGLSQRSRYFRFFSIHPALPQVDAKHLADVDGDERMAFVADLDGSIVGVGRYDRDPDDRSTAEVAFAVADDLQGHGIGTALLHRLADHASGVGVERFLAYVLPANHRMLDLFSDVVGPLHCAFDDGVVVVRFDVAAVDC